MGAPRTPVGTGGRVSTKRLADTKKGEPRWRALTWVRDADGVSRQVQAVGASERKAEAALRAKIASRFVGSVENITGDTPLSVLATTWRDNMLKNTRLSDGTREAYERAIDKHIIPAIGHLRLSEVTPGACVRFFKALGSQYKQVRTVLKQVLDEALIEGVYQFNPVTAAPRVVPTVVKEKKKPRVPTEREFVALRVGIRKWADSVMGGHGKKWMPLDDIVLFQAGTGTRRSEALAPMWMDVDLDRGIVDVSAALKGKKGVGLVRETPKSGSSGEVAIPPVVVEMLRRRLADAPPHLSGPLSPVFPSMAGTFIWPNNYARCWREAREMAPGDLSWIVPHNLRKAATTAVIDEFGMEEGSKYARHSSTRVTEEFYYDKSAKRADPREVMEGLLSAWRRPIA